MSDEIAQLRAEVAALAAKAQQAEDYVAICNLQAAYGYYVDKGRWDDAAELFAEDGSLVRHPIQTGITSGGDVEIIGGLNGTEPLIGINAGAFREGQRVQVAEPATATAAGSPTSRRPTSPIRTSRPRTTCSPQAGLGCTCTTARRSSS